MFLLLKQVGCKGKRAIAGGHVELREDFAVVAAVRILSATDLIKGRQYGEGEAGEKENG